eukprot:g3031.t1
MAECKTEVNSTDNNLKAQAVLKLMYLQLLDYDTSWAAFHIVEVMSQSLFRHKRIGYLAAEQCFTSKTDVVLLCTNLLKKEMQSKNQYSVGLAINCLSNIATKDVSRVLLGDVVNMLQCPRPYIRKKAVLVLYKMFLKYPQGLRLCFDHLRSKLEDKDPSVVSSAVNVICELSRKKPKNYLALAPQLYKLLTSSRNNWMLIKVVKLLGELVPEEPRLARKILDPLVKIIKTTSAKSLLYECLKTITFSLPYTTRQDGRRAKNVTEIVRLCTKKLKDFVQDSDQNLKYLGLVGLVNLMRFSPEVVYEHRALVLECLNDDDVTVRLQALELVTGMITKQNIESIVDTLSENVLTAEGHYRDELISKIIQICSRDKYVDVTDFAWYTSVLSNLARTKGSQHEEMIGNQLMDVALRVPTVRAYAVRCMQAILVESCGRARGGDVSRSGGSSSKPGGGSSGNGGGGAGERVLSAAAWIVGEYAELVKRPATVLQTLVATSVLHRSSVVQVVFLNAALKLCVTKDESDLWKTLSNEIVRFSSSSSSNVDVQERALMIVAIARSAACSDTEDDIIVGEEKEAKLLDDGDDDRFAGEESSETTTKTKQRRHLLDRLRVILSEKLGPVSERAQRKVPIPMGLDLDAYIHEGARAFDEAVDDTSAGGVVRFCESDDGEEEEDDDDEEESDKDDDQNFRVQGSSFSRGARSPSFENRRGRRRRRHRRRRRRGRLESARPFDGGDSDDEIVRKNRRKSRDAFYLSSAPNAAFDGARTDEEDEEESLDVDDIPIKRLGESGVLRNIGSDGDGDDADNTGTSGDDDDDDDDVPRRRRKKKNVEYEVLRDELMPEGAADDEEDAVEDTTGGDLFSVTRTDKRGHVRKLPSNATSNGNVGDEELDGSGGSDPELGDIDITKPLGEGEVIPTLQHRVVRDGGRVDASKADRRRNLEGRAVGGRKKKKKKKKKRASRRARDDAGETETDLLGDLSESIAANATPSDSVDLLVFGEATGENGPNAAPPPQAVGVVEAARRRRRRRGKRSDGVIVMQKTEAKGVVVGTTRTKTGVF